MDEVKRRPSEKLIMVSASNGLFCLADDCREWRRSLLSASCFCVSSGGGLWLIFHSSGRAQENFFSVFGLWALNLFVHRTFFLFPVPFHPFPIFQMKSSALLFLSLFGIEVISAQCELSSHYQLYLFSSFHRPLCQLYSSRSDDHQ